MIIDVEIKIADDNGITLKHYVKRMEDIKDGTIRLEDITGTGTSFKELLDRYLSQSGRKVREKLFPTARLYNENLRTAVNIKLLEGRNRELIHQTPAQAVQKYEASFHTLEEESFQNNNET